MAVKWCLVGNLKGVGRFFTYFVWRCEEKNVFLSPILWNRQLTINYSKNYFFNEKDYFLILEKYAKASGALYVKYVLMPGFNDTIDEIKGWLEHCQYAGVKRIAFDIEDHWFKANRHHIPQHIYDLFDYVIKNHGYYGLNEYQLYERAMNLREDRRKKQEQI